MIKALQRMDDFREGFDVIALHLGVSNCQHGLKNTLCEIHKNERLTVTSGAELIS